MQKVVITEGLCRRRSGTSWCPVYGMQLLCVIWATDLGLMVKNSPYIADTALMRSRIKERNAAGKIVRRRWQILHR